MIIIIKFYKVERLYAPLAPQPFTGATMNRQLIQLCFRLTLLSLAVAVGLTPASAIAVAESTSARQIEQVVVVGKDLAGRTTSVGKMDVPLTETPFSVSILTEDFFTATGVKTLQDALQYSAGVAGGTYGIDTRGDWSTIPALHPTPLSGLRF